MILYIEPVADIQAITVYREFLALQRIVDHEGNELLRELIRAVIIGAVRDIRREVICVHISFHQEIRARF